MLLPPDFEATLDKVQKLGIAQEGAGQIRDHLVLAVRAAGEVHQASGAIEGDLGFIDWSTKTLQKCEIAIHNEICDPSGKGLKDQYRDILEKASGDDQVKQIASAITGVIATINPALAVSSVVVYFALWLTKVGLDYWCKGSSDLT
jgi:hypothetical protein